MIEVNRTWRTLLLFPPSRTWVILFKPLWNCGKVLSRTSYVFLLWNYSVLCHIEVSDTVRSWQFAKIIKNPRWPPRSCDPCSAPLMVLKSQGWSISLPSPILEKWTFTKLWRVDQVMSFHAGRHLVHMVNVLNHGQSLFVYDLQNMGHFFRTTLKPWKLTLRDLFFTFLVQILGSSLSCVFWGVRSWKFAKIIKNPRWPPRSRDLKSRDPGLPCTFPILQGYWPTMPRIISGE